MRSERGARVVSIKGRGVALGCLAAFCGYLRTAAPASGVDEPAPPDKTGYTFFNPTPREHLREMEALYEGPYTVDAGHVQIEMYVFAYTHQSESSREVETRSDQWSIAAVNIKVGLLNNLDGQLFIASYSNLRTDERPGGVSWRSGFGDITPRMKWNLWGNDSGSSALGLTPFVKLPTNQDNLGNHAVEGGLIMPIALELPKQWWLGMAPEFDWLHTVNRGGYHFEFASRNYLWHELIGGLSGYVEFDNRVSAEQDQGWIGVLGLGFSLKATSDLQLDTGLLFGVTTAAADVNVFFGASYRF